MMQVAGGDRVAAKEVADFTTQPLADPDTRRAISTLLQLLSSCYGPDARPTLIHNNCGGHVTLTTSAARLLQSTSVSRPVLRLVTTAIQQHLILYGDCGLLAAQLCLGLIDRSLDITVHRRLTAQINEHLLKCCLDYLYSESCTCRVAVDFSTTGDLLKLAESAVNTKPVCGFLAGDARHISKLIVEAFLKCFPATSTDSTWGIIEYVGLEGSGVGESYLLDGVLIETPHIASYSVRPLAGRCVEDGPRRGLLRVALFNTSLAGETNMSVDAEYQLEPDVDFSGAVVGELLECGERLVALGVEVVLCQKVIHPRLKRFLKRNNLLVLDRLGLQRTIAVHRLVGGRLLGSHQTATQEGDWGYLHSATHLMVAHKSYVHLETAPPGGSVCTLVLCARTDEAVDELKGTCKTAQQVLRMTSQQPLALVGGGCWLTHLAHVVITMFSEKWSQWSKEYNCSKLQLQTIVGSFAANLKHIATTVNKGDSRIVADSEYHHAWRVPPGVDVQDTVMSSLLAKCQCGQVRNRGEYNSHHERPSRLDANTNMSSSCEVLDSFLASTKALNTAVSVANMVLCIEHCVQEP